MSNDYWLRRLQCANEQMAEVENPRLRDVYRKLAEHYRAMQEICAGNGKEIEIAVEDVQGSCWTGRTLGGAFRRPADGSGRVSPRRAVGRLV